MKNFFTVTLLTGFLLLTGSFLCAQEGHVDPSYLQIQSAENPITLDGKLDETDWMRRFDHLAFKLGYKPGDIEYDVTDGVLVDGVYKDTTTTLIKVLHYGLDLYISLTSDDKYVNKWGGSWEGDGLFMKIQQAGGTFVEYKLFFNAAGVDPDIVFETNAPAGSGEGVAWKRPGTIVNDTTQIDSGYTAELVIHLADLGYTDPYCEVPVLFNIFDPDGQTGTAGEELTIGSFYKRWWGSEWGPITRTLRLADPPSKIAIKTEETITLDGQLNESFWENADYLEIAEGSHLSTGGYYMQWGDTLNEYSDKSSAIVKFAHSGTALYIGVVSNDSSVCHWYPGWECDGLFIFMTYKDVIPEPADRLEIQNWYADVNEGASAVMVVKANVPTGAAEGASYEPSGTVTHTETNGADEGYSLETVIHTEMFGYSDGDTVKIAMTIWDIDYASSDAYDEHVSDLRPLWWGTQWADKNFEKYYMFRDVILSDRTSVGVGDKEPAAAIKEFRLKQNYPNPFNPTTAISYQLSAISDVELSIYNTIGQKVATLVSEEQPAGSYEYEWDATGFDSGIYFYRISTPKLSQTMKMILMK